MSTMASQITSASIVYSTVCSGAAQRKHQSSVWLAFVRGIHWWLVNSPHKGTVTWKMFPFDDVIMALRVRSLGCHTVTIRIQDTSTCETGNTLIWYMYQIILERKNASVSALMAHSLGYYKRTIHFNEAVIYKTGIIPKSSLIRTLNICQYRGTWGTWGLYTI